MHVLGWLAYGMIIVYALTSAVVVSVLAALGGTVMRCATRQHEVKTTS